MMYNQNVASPSGAGGIDSSSNTLMQLNSTTAHDSASRRNSHSTNQAHFSNKPLLRGLLSKHQSNHCNSNASSSIPQQKGSNHNVDNAAKEKNSYSQTLDAIH